MKIENKADSRDTQEESQSRVSRVLKMTDLEIFQLQDEKVKKSREFELI